MIAPTLTLEPVGPAVSPGHRIVLPGQTPAGEPILSVLVKRTYDIVDGRRCARAAQDLKLVAGDVHYGDPMNSTPRYESDFVPWKLATDVVFLGSACAPGGEPVDSFTASLSVGTYRKDLLLVGDRVALFRAFRVPVFTDPKPLVSLALRYEQAYGGVDIDSNPKMPVAYLRNPLGKGFVVANKKRSVDRRPLPNIEDPHDRLTPDRFCAQDPKKWEGQPMPQGFGWVAKSWRQRSRFAGVMPGDRAVERELRQAYTALVPPAQQKLYTQTQLADMDFRFFSGASPGLAVPFLGGDEAVELTNLSAGGKVAFQLPGERPKIGLDIGQGIFEPEVVLQTVQIRMEGAAPQADLVWRGAVPYRGRDWLPEMRRMEVVVR